MSRFDIYTLADRKEYGIDIQSELVDFLPTRLIIPLVEETRISRKLPEIHLPIEINGQTLYAVTNMIAAVPARQLRKRIGSAERYWSEITSAIDYVLQGV